MSITEKPIFIDTITESDLLIFDKRKETMSLLKFLDRTQSFGGKCMLETMLRQPLTDKRALSERLDMIEFVSLNDIEVTISREILDFIEYYYTLKIPSRTSWVDSVVKGVSHLLKSKNEQYIIKRSVNFLIEIIRELKQFTEKYQGKTDIIDRYISKINTLYDSNEIFSHLLSLKENPRLSMYNYDRYDHLFRYAKRNEMRELLSILYEIDNYVGLSQLLRGGGFCIPELSDKEGIDIKGLHHPFLEKGIPNDLVLNKDKNMCFITGANMSGKSTFMKAFGIAAYLAHVGFPVPAAKMTFSVYDAIFTSINITDNITLGYSHFYSEIQRIKTVAEHINRPAKLIVIFDELFRGTNLKDAHEAYAEVIKAFSRKTDSLFLLSTHILEVAEELKEIETIYFSSFKTELIENELKYSYMLQEGISDDRYGMYLLRKEKVIERIG